METTGRATQGTVLSYLSFLLLLWHALTIVHRKQIADLAEQYRRTASYIDKILRGAKPPDPPVEQPTKFELDHHLKTAKALGITVPDAILLRADEVIR